MHRDICEGNREESSFCLFILFFNSVIISCRLRLCRLTAACCGDLSSALSTSQTLAELNLQDNRLEDSGVQLLCEALKRPNCKLQKIKLRGCHLTDACCGDLSSVLSTSQTLSELNLKHNKLEDSGVQLLCEGLKHSHCKLQKLKLANCDLTAACCGDLSSVFSTRQTLTELDLRNNKLEDSGMRLLCEGLKHPNCKLQNLRLSRCDFTVACCGELFSALGSNRALRELDVCENKLEDSGVKQLCEGLKHRNSRVQKLWLWQCGLTAACCGDLSAALSTNQSLTELELTSNIGTVPIKSGHLVTLLYCSLCSLCRLWQCGLTAACCGDLSAALSTNQSLTELELSGNKLGDSGIKLLCEGLKHPSCKLVWDCHLTDACCGALSSLLSTNQSLRELNLSSNKLSYSGVKLLCEGLRHPNCQLQKLEIHHNVYWAEEFQERQQQLWQTHSLMST
uniref:Uncharacterized protein n=1 Tax=Chelonoidis abingdonii TaxID=106734 RepID=A0A8C0G0S9_CHEAB